MTEGPLTGARLLKATEWAPESNKVLMFVSEKLPNNAVTSQSMIVLAVLVVEHCGGLTALFVVFLETNMNISQDLGAQWYYS